MVIVDSISGFSHDREEESDGGMVGSGLGKLPLVDEESQLQVVQPGAGSEEIFSDSFRDEFDEFHRLNDDDAYFRQKTPPSPSPVRPNYSRLQR